MQDDDKRLSLVIKYPAAQAHLYFTAHPHQRALKMIWASHKVFSAFPRWKLLLSKKSYWNNSLCWWVYPLQLNLHQLGSSRGFGTALLPLHQNESEPTPILHLPLKTWAEQSLINLAWSSPSFHIFPVFSEPEHKQDSLACTDLFRLALFISLSRLYRVI